MKKKTKYRILIGISCCIAVGLAYLGYLYFMTPQITFVKNSETLEINSTYNAKDFIEKVSNADVKKVEINDTVDIKKLGSYTITYIVDGKEFTLECTVVDTKKPEVTFQNANVSINEKPDASIFIKAIKDDTKTTVSFKETPVFDKLGKQKVVVLVKDEGNNVTEKEVSVQVLPKDTKAPVIHGAENQNIAVDSKIDVLKGIRATDERDGEVTVKVDKKELDIKTPGSYKVIYTATDRAGNTATRTVIITVQDKVVSNTGEKIVYLTIDDGPSANTPKILDILDRYNVKATFFVTAQSPRYISYIKTAYQKGHAIGLHTYSHNYDVLYASETAYFNDLQKISDVVKQQTGITSKIIRFPGGSSNTVSHNVPGLMTKLSKDVRARGYQYYDWNSESGDGNSANPASKLISVAKSFGGSGPLMMLTHDHAGSYSSVQALPAIIEYYKGLGYTFKTVDTSVPGYHHGINN